jgi:hypothetical protein
MQDSSQLGYRAPLRFLSAALVRPFGVRCCVFCHRRIVGLPYPHREPALTFCNSHCHAFYFRRLKRA